MFSRVVFGVSIVLCPGCRAPSDSSTTPVAPALSARVEPVETPGAAVPAPAPSASAASPDAGADLRPIAVRQLVAEPEPGRYLLDAYIVELRPCPVCEAPLRCKPCPSDHIIVADEPTAAAGTPTAMLRVGADQIQTLGTGVRYRLEIQVHPAVEGGRGINYMEVLKVERL